MSNKNAYVQKMQSKLDELDAQIDLLQAKASGASADAKIDFNEQIDSLKEYQKEGKEKLAELNDASEGAWEDIRDGMDSAWNKVSTAFNGAKNRFS
ncbi:hypothetical protein AU255_09380 [Methyloprofundus sedimenti]|uniref:Coiled coil domain-containing protein n=1 Tax=Methyloprofundus sedimenti TaxID=1420851 RepID=A0A1V8M950_9GAMM|nr:hypothetical protein [Methyloprofundus sedimenti]OQK18046.1 hypothetical protein AU255_09380 [Methyloprofundus sedimenti]